LSAKEFSNDFRAFSHAHDSRFASYSFILNKWVGISESIVCMVMEKYAVIFFQYGVDGSSK
jgi:hypothetical protein